MKKILSEQPPKRRLRVKELLAEQHMGMAKLSRRGWLALGTVKKICRNPFHPAKEVTLEKIAKVPGMPVSALFEEVPEVPDVPHNSQ